VGLTTLYKEGSQARKHQTVNNFNYQHLAAIIS